MPFHVLDPVKDRNAWLTILAKIGPSASDPHFSPWYLEAERLLGGTPLLATYQYEHYFIIKPFVLRDVVIGGQTFGRDITNPYGYGGPVSNHGSRLHEWFDQEFTEWCQRMNVICEHCALNSMHVVHQRSLLRTTKGINLRERKEVVWMDLKNKGWANTEAAVKGVGYRDTRIAGVKAAQRSGITVRRGESPQDIDVFINFYGAAMERKNAPSRWRFPKEYLWALGEACGVFLAEVPESGVASAALVMTGGDCAYYHMAASAPDYPKSGANDLLVHEIALWARTYGVKRFHLGGGVTSDPNDSVMFFKSGFSPLRAPAMSYFRVFNESLYRLACVAKAEEEINQTGAEFASSFEPMYRREAL